MKVLLFYPHNPFELVRGVDVRFFYLIKSLKGLGYKVDLFTIKNYVSRWDKIESYYYDYVDDIFFFDHKIAMEENKGRKAYLTNEVSESMKNFLKELLKKKNYSHFIVSYVFWADLADVVYDKMSKIIMIEDFISMNLLGRQIISEKEFPFVFEEEIKRIRKFDKAIFLSIDEMLLFNPFLKSLKSYLLFPSFPFRGITNTFKKREYDLFFIGYDNPSNIEGMQWFFEKVYPKIDKRIKILVVGRITKHIKDYDNVKKVSYVNDLSEIYNSIKISVVPLFSGTGIKIKVIEAMSFGIPVVTTLYGVTGLINKADNGCLIADDEKTFALYIKELLSNEKKYFEVREKGIREFREHYSIEKFNFKIKELMED